MADGIKGLFVMFLLVGLFAIAGLGFVITLENENDANLTITTNPAIANLSSDLTSELYTSEDVAAEGEESFIAEVGEEPEGELTSGAARKSGSNYLSRIKTIFNALFSLIKGVIGINPVVFSVLLTILTAFGILAIWRLIKQGF